MGPQALLGYAYSAHQGQINRHIVNGLFYRLGASRLQAGTVCDTCCETAWDLTLGPVGGADPELVVDSDLAIAWGCDLMAVNVHFWAKLEMIRRTGVKVVVIDPRRSRRSTNAGSPKACRRPTCISASISAWCSTATSAARSGSTSPSSVRRSTRWRGSRRCAGRSISRALRSASDGARWSPPN